MSAFSRPSSVSTVAHLLREAGLPSSDLTSAHLEHFLACGSSDAPEGIAGIELHGDVALLRSLAVSAKSRGRGYGRQLVVQAERLAQSQGAKEMYLLTTTAVRFFERLGFVRVEREAAPVTIQRTQEFATLCPSSSTVMMKQLPANPTVERDAPRAARPSL